MSKFILNKTLTRSIILGVGIILIAAFINKRLSNAAPKQGPKISFRDKVVDVVKAEPSSIDVKIKVSGRLQSTKRMEIYSEVTGVLTNQNFKAGNRFGTGQVVAAIDNREFSAQLKAQKSAYLGLLSQALPDITIDYPENAEAWKNFISNIDPSKPLPPLPEVNNQQLKQFLSSRNILTNYYTIIGQQERLNKHTITAPYSGVLSEVLIDPGTLVRAGQKIGTYVQQGSYELEASLSKQDLEHLSLGKKVQLRSDESDKVYTGVISRINSVIDPNTQMMSAFLTVQGEGLREGLYLTAVIDGGTVNDALKVKRNLITDGRIFSVQSDSTLKLLDIKVMNYDQDMAIITGVEEGTLLPTQMVSGGFEEMKIIPHFKEAK